MKKMKVKSFRPLKFRATPYSILVEDLNDGIITALERALPPIPKEQQCRLADALFQEIALILTEDIDFES